MFPLKSMVGNFLLMYLMADSMPLSVRRESRVFGFVQVCDRGNDKDDVITLHLGFVRSDLLAVKSLIFNTFSYPIMLLWVCLTWFHCNLFSEKVRKASLSEESVWILRLAEQIVDSNNAFHTSLNNKPQGDLGQAVNIKLPQWGCS